MSKGIFSYLKPVLFCSLIGLICSIIYFCVCAVLVSSVDIPSSVYHWISLLGVIMMSFITSFTCSKIMGQKALYFGLLCSAVLIVFLLLGSIIINTSIVSMIIKSAIIGLVCVIGAVFGVK